MTGNEYKGKEQCVIRYEHNTNICLILSHTLSNYGFCIHLEKRFFAFFQGIYNLQSRGSITYFWCAQLLPHLVLFCLWTATYFSWDKFFYTFLQKIQFYTSFWFWMSEIFEKIFEINMIAIELFFRRTTDWEPLSECIEKHKVLDT
jgi:hypothetical protein